MSRGKQAIDACTTHHLVVGSRESTYLASAPPTEHLAVAVRFVTCSDAGVVQRALPVLILTSHASTAGLISTFVSLSGHTAMLPLDDEAVTDALLRIRPRVVIIDFEHACMTSPRIETQLAAIGARVILCSAWHGSIEARQRAAVMGSLCFSLPIEHKDFDLLLRTAMLL